MIKYLIGTVAVEEAIFRYKTASPTSPLRLGGCIEAIVLEEQHGRAVPFLDGSSGFRSNTLMI